MQDDEDIKPEDLLAPLDDAGAYLLQKSRKQRLPKFGNNAVPKVTRKLTDEEIAQIERFSGLPPEE